MNIKILLGAAVLASTIASPGAAAPIYLDFTLQGSTGTFYGLDNELVGKQTASSWDWSGGYDTYTNMGMILNGFTFLSGELTDVDFRITGVSDNNLATFRFRGRSFSTPDSSFWSDSDEVSLCGRPGCPDNLWRDLVRTEQRLVSPVPLPAGGLLLLSGLAGVAALKRRKKRAA